MSVPLSANLSSTSITVEDFVTALKAQKISKGTVLEINGSEYIFKSVNGNYAYVFCENDRTFTLPKPFINGSSVPSNLIKSVKIFNVIAANTIQPIAFEQKGENLLALKKIIERAEKILNEGGRLIEAQSSFVYDMHNHGFLAADEAFLVFALSGVEEFKNLMRSL